MAVLFLPSNALAREDVTFDFAGNPWGLPLSATGTESNGELGTGSIVQDGVTFTTTDGGTKTRLWNSGTAIDLRVYKNGGSFTFTAPEGQVIEKIELSGTVAATAGTGTYDSTTKTWTQPEEQVGTVKFTVTSNSKITKAVVTIAAPGEAPEVVVLPTAENIAAFKALATDTEAELTLTDAKVLYVSGSEMIVEDATGAIDFYNIGLTATAGQVLNGTIAGKSSVYNGLPQLAKTSNTDVATVTVKDGDAPVAVEMTVADAMAETSFLKYVKLTDATLVLDGTTYYLVNGDNKIQIYNKFKLDYTLPEAIKSFAGIIIPYKKGTADLIVEIAPIAVEDIVAPLSLPNGDVTSLVLANPGFEECEANTEDLKTASAAGVDYTAQGWTITASGGYCNAAAFEYGSAAKLNDCIAPAADNAGNSGKTMGVTVAWSSNVKYTTASPITLPAGIYTIKINGYNSYGSATLFHSNFAFVAEDNTVIASSSKSNFASNVWEEDVLSFTLDAETTGNITFGGYAENKGSGSHARVFFDNIKISHFADLLSQAVADLNETITKAQSVAAAGLAPTTDIDAAIAAAQAATSETEVENVKAAKETLQAAVATYNELNTHFVALADFKAYFVADPYTYASEESKTNYNTLAAKTPANAEEADANLAELQLAARAIAESHAKAEGVVDATDQTSVIVNPNAEAMDGWTTVKGEGSGGKLEVKSGEPFTDAAGSTDHPYFDGGDWNAKAWDVTLQQTVSLPKGKYMLSATSRASTGMASFAIFAGEARTEMAHVGNSGGIFDRGYNLSSVEFEVTEETADVNIGVQGVAAVQYQWMSFTRFQLVKLDKSEAVDPDPEPQPEPAIADGTYYLYNEAGKVFFERGGLYGTQAVVGKYGLPVDITTVDGATTLAMHDWAGTVIGFDEGIYADASGADARTYTVKPVEGGFVFVNNNNYALTIVDGAVNGVLDGEGTVWAVKTLEERNAILEATVAADKSAAIAAAGYPEDVEFETTDCTEKVASASLTGSIDGWTWTEVRKPEAFATNVNGTECYKGTGTLSQTVTGLEQGLYRVTVNGLYRDGWNANQVTMAADGFYNSTAYLAANGVQAQITPWAKDRVADGNPNSMADYNSIISEDATKYLSELYTTVGEEGELAISINIPSFIDAGWCIFSNVTLTRLSYTAPEPEPTLPEDGTYYIKNVATGKYLAGGSSWGTHAIVDAHGMDLGLAVLEDGKYTIDTQLSNGGEKHYLNGVYCDGAAFGWTLTMTKTDAGEDAVIISDGTNNLTTAEGTDEVALAENVDDYSKWICVSVEERMAELLTATADNGKDASWLLPGRNFGRNDLRNSNWNGTLSIGGDNTNMCAERFNTTFDVYQTINVPNGKYTVEVQGFYRNGGYVDAAGKHVDGSEQLLAAAYANTVETPLQSIFAEAGNCEAEGTATTDGIEGAFPNNMKAASAFFTAGLYNNVIENVVVVDGTLTVGVRKSEATANDWSIFDNFRITYYGEIQDLTIYKEAYEAALAAAQAALADEANAVVTGEERTALEAAITANTTVEETKDAYVAATTALNEAAATFKAATAAYQALEDARVAYAFDANAYPYASSTKLAVLNEALAATATNATEAQTMTAAIVVAARDYVESNAVAEEQGAVDFTENIVNPNAENGTEGWTVSLGEGSGGEIKVLNGEPFTDAAGSSTHSYFDGGNWGANAWDVSVSQEVTLPSGEYLLTVTSRASSDMASFQLFANDESVEMKHVGNGGELFDRGWNDSFLVFNVHEDNAPVAIGVQGVADVLHQWMSFTRFRLVRLGDANIINGIQTENLDNATIYSVNGQVVRTNATTTKGLAKGIYVVNGKKVVVK